MICQIYTIQTSDEAIKLIEAGVDHIGITPTQCGLPGEVTIEQAKNIFDAIGSKATKVALSVDDNPDAVIKMLLALKPDIVHLTGFKLFATPEFVAKIKKTCPDVRVMQAVAVNRPDAVNKAKYFSEFVDLILLDSVDLNNDVIGASGITNDWNISKKIVEISKVPVILAGGLNPENVAEAIRIVKPWGVDSMTKTDKILANGGFIKDIERVTEFCKVAKSVQL